MKAPIDLEKLKEKHRRYFNDDHKYTPAYWTLEQATLSSDMVRAIPDLIELLEQAQHVVSAILQNPDDLKGCEEFLSRFQKEKE